MEEKSSIKGSKPDLVIFDELILGKVNKNKPFKRDKSLNTPEFNSKAKKRREKAKSAKKSRKGNRGK